MSDETNKDEKPKRISVTIYADDVHLIGMDTPTLENVEDVLRYFATVHDRFGNTAVTINASTSWGGSALHARDRLQRELSDVKAENEKYEALVGNADEIKTPDFWVLRVGAGNVWQAKRRNGDWGTVCETALEAFEAITAQADSAA